MFGSDKCVELSLIHTLLEEKFTQLILRSIVCLQGENIWEMI